MHQVAKKNSSPFSFSLHLFIGTAVELKHNFGLSYNIHIQTSDANITSITSLVHSFSADAPIVEKLDGALTFRIPPAQINVLGPLLGALEDQRQKGVVEECGITETSLEDVFLGVTREAGFK